MERRAGEESCVVASEVEMKAAVHFAGGHSTLGDQGVGPCKRATRQHVKSGVPDSPLSFGAAVM